MINQPVAGATHSSLFFVIFESCIAATSDKKLPVMVFLHGESFEWNSGNPYDGTVLASYSEIVVVTLNYRLGILGKFIPLKLNYVRPACRTRVCRSSDTKLKREKKS